MSAVEPTDPSRVFAEHHEALSRYLIRFTGDPDLAADLVQETFVRLLEQPPEPNAARAWLFRVATNLAFDAARARKRRRLLLARSPSRLPHGDPPPEPDRCAEAAERTRILQRALASLSEKERTALLLREEGFKHEEIAAAIGTATSTVGTLMARAVRKLAGMVDLQREDL